MSRSFVLVADRRQVRWFTEGLRPKSPVITGASALTFVALMIGPAFTQAGLARAAQEPKPGSQSQPDLPNAPTAFVVETRKVLKELQETLSGFAIRTLANIEQEGPQEGDISSQRLMVESAKAQFEAAEGARELAQLALKEYKEGIVKQEHAALEAELKFAQDELKHATAKVDQAKDRYAKIKAASKGSVYDLAQEWRFEFGDVVAELEVRKAQLKVEQTESKLKRLREHSANGNTKKLTGEVEKARSDELAKKATWELEQAKLLKLQRRTRRWPPAYRPPKAACWPSWTRPSRLKSSWAKSSRSAREREMRTSRSARQSKPWPGASPPLSKGDAMRRPMRLWRR